MVTIHIMQNKHKLKNNLHINIVVIV